MAVNAEKESIGSYPLADSPICEFVDRQIPQHLHEFSHKVRADAWSFLQAHGGAAVGTAAGERLSLSGR